MRLVATLLLLVTLLSASVLGVQRRTVRKPAGDPELAKKIRRFAPTS